MRVWEIILWCNITLASTPCLWLSCSFLNYWEASCSSRWEFFHLITWIEVTHLWRLRFVIREPCAPHRNSTTNFSRRSFAVPWSFSTRRPRLAYSTDLIKTWMKVNSHLDVVYYRIYLPNILPFSFLFSQWIRVCRFKLKCSFRTCFWSCFVWAWSAAFSHGSWWQLGRWCFSLLCCTLCRGSLLENSSD